MKNIDIILRMPYTQSTSFFNPTEKKVIKTKINSMAHPTSWFQQTFKNSSDKIGTIEPYDDAYIESFMKDVNDLAIKLRNNLK